MMLYIDLKEIQVVRTTATVGQVELHRHFTGELDDVKINIERVDAAARDKECRLVEQEQYSRTLGERIAKMERKTEDKDGKLYLYSFEELQLSAHIKHSVWFLLFITSIFHVHVYTVGKRRGIHCADHQSDIVKNDNYIYFCRYASIKRRYPIM